MFNNFLTSLHTLAFALLNPTSFRYLMRSIFG